MREQAGKSWFTPEGLLAMFCAMSLMVYIDRGCIASNGINGAPSGPEGKGSGIQGDFGLSLFQDGLLPAAFMVGLLVSSPLFAEASKHYNAFRLIGIGLGIWAVAVAGCGLSVGFVSLLLCRMAVGIGEASFVALASPFIDDNAPPDRKARWLALFYLCIPTGYAIGYIYGGLVAAAVGWRAAFLLLAGAMVPFVIFCLRAPPIDIRGTHAKKHAHGAKKQRKGRERSSGGGGSSLVPGDAEAAPTVRARGEEGSLLGGRQRSDATRPGGGEGEEVGVAGSKSRLLAGLAEVWGDLAELASHKVYVLTVGAMSAYTAVLGTFAFYAPKAGRDVFDIHPEQADLAFGAITVVTGVFGTLVGGVLLDKLGSTISNALALCALSTAAGCILIVADFLLAKGFALFAVALAAGQFAMFMTQAPSNALCMWTVPLGLRPFAMSVMVVAMHLLGDVPGPPLLGLLQGHLNNWRLSMSLASLVLLLSAALYALAIRAARHATDYRTAGAQEEEEEEGSEGGEAGVGLGAERDAEHGGMAAYVGGGGEGRHSGHSSGRYSPEEELVGYREHEGGDWEEGTSHKRSRSSGDGRAPSPEQPLLQQGGVRRPSDALAPHLD